MPFLRMVRCPATPPECAAMNDAPEEKALDACCDEDAVKMAAIKLWNRVPSIPIKLPVLPPMMLPRPVIQARVQPVAVSELAEVAAKLLGPASDRTGVIDCVGPEALTLGSFIASLRQQLGKHTALVAPLPDLLTRLSARAGDSIPLSPWCTESLALLAQDNVSDPGLFETILARRGTPCDRLVEAVWR